MIGMMFILLWLLKIILGNRSSAFGEFAKRVDRVCTFMYYTF